MEVGVASLAMNPSDPTGGISVTTTLSFEGFEALVPKEEITAIRRYSKSPIEL